MDYRDRKSDGGPGLGSVFGGVFLAMLLAGAVSAMQEYYQTPEGKAKLARSRERWSKALWGIAWVVFFPYVLVIYLVLLAVDAAKGFPSRDWRFRRKW